MNKVCLQCRNKLSTVYLLAHKYNDQEKKEVFRKVSCYNCPSTDFKYIKPNK